MKKEVLATIIVLICFAFAYTDYSLNNYEESFRIWQRNEEASKDFTDNNQGEIFVAPIPDTNPLLLPENSTSENPFRNSAPQIITPPPLNTAIQNQSIDVTIQSEKVVTTLASILPESAIPFTQSLTHFEVQNPNADFHIYQIAAEAKKSPLSYQSIQDNIRNLGDENYTVNITNAFGNASFYINSQSEADTAFLVVLLQESDYVYLFKYPKSIHSDIEKIINALSN